jgi:hypothetical protein
MKKQDVSSKKKNQKLDLNLDKALEEVAKKLRPTADCEPDGGGGTGQSPQCSVYG